MIIAGRLSNSDFLQAIKVSYRPIILLCRPYSALYSVFVERDKNNLRQAFDN